MQNLICSRPFSGAELISEELQSHDEDPFFMWDCSSDNTANTYPDFNIYFENPNTLMDYVEKHPEDIFHIVYIEVDKDIRKMISATDMAFDSTEAEAKYYKEEDELYTPFEEKLKGVKSGSLPTNISGVMWLHHDFTPQSIANKAITIAANKIAYDNAKYIVNCAIDQDILDADENNYILAPTQDEPEHRMPFDKVCDRLNDDSDELGRLMSSLIYYENLFK